MISPENQIYSLLANALRESFPGVFVTGEYLPAPAKFPCVSIEEKENATYRRTQSTGHMENHALVGYEINIYSNKTTGKKSQVKAIAELVDDVMLSLGFDRSMMTTVPNYADATIYRMTLRYRAVVDKNNVIYRV